jgi:hypothetical protein
MVYAFSKKVENLAHAVSLHYMHYNFARAHQTAHQEGWRPDHPCYGCRDHRPRLVAHRDRRATRLTRKAHESALVMAGSRSWCGPSGSARRLPPCSS